MIYTRQASGPGAQLASSVSDFLHVTTGGFAPPRRRRFKWQEECDRFQRGSNDVCCREQGIQSVHVHQVPCDQEELASNVTGFFFLVSR